MSEFAESPTEVAERVVERILNEYASPDEFHERPGGKNDPWRKTSVAMKFRSKDFTGKRPGSSGKECDPDKDENCPPAKPKKRFDVKFEGKAPIAKAPGVIKTKKVSGKTDDRTSAASAIKGKSGTSAKTGVIAGAPGKVKHESIARAIYGKSFESLTFIQQERVQEAVFQTAPARRVYEDSAKVRCDDCHWADDKHAPWCSSKGEGEMKDNDEGRSSDGNEKDAKGYDESNAEPGLGASARSLLDRITG